MDTTDDIVIPRLTSWLNDPDAKAVCAAIEQGGHRIYFVGGCVRNALLGLQDTDVDLATDARPEQVIELAQAAGLKTVPTGIDHGTVTVVSGAAAFEVTTFRLDVATDGRRAKVVFSDDIVEDARRRDFTINALYATSDGVVIDPLDGMRDLQNRRIRFIENAADRIREDYLRTLRFFRFSAWYADASAGFDKTAMDAIARNLEGLNLLSAERVGHEMRKLLSAPDPCVALSGMRASGVLNSILPGGNDKMIAPVVHFELTLGVQPRWLCRLATLGGSGVEDRLRLTNAEKRELAILNEVGFFGPPLREVAYRYGRDTAISTVLLRAAMAETAPDPKALREIAQACAAEFPISAKDLMPEYQGPALGKRLAELEQHWITSGFAMKKSHLLNYG